jgi:hypothetical protein
MATNGMSGDFQCPYCGSRVRGLQERDDLQSHSMESGALVPGKRNRMSAGRIRCTVCFNLITERLNTHLLEQASSAVVIRRNLRSSGGWSMLWGAFAVLSGLAGLSQSGCNAVLILIGLFLIGSGWASRNNPSQGTLQADALGFLLVGGWNILLNILVMQEGGSPDMFMFLGGLQIFWGIQRFATSVKLGQLSAVPDPVVAHVEKLVEGLINANGKIDQDLIIFWSKGREWRTRLLPHLSVLAQATGQEPHFLDPDQFNLQKVGEPKKGNRVDIQAQVGSETWKGQADPQMLERFTRQRELQERVVTLEASLAERPPVPMGSLNAAQGIQPIPENGRSSPVAAPPAPQSPLAAVEAVGSGKATISLPVQASNQGAQQPQQAVSQPGGASSIGSGKAATGLLDLKPGTPKPLSTPLPVFQAAPGTLNIPQGAPRRRLSWIWILAGIGVLFALALVVLMVPRVLSILVPPPTAVVASSPIPQVVIVYITATPLPTATETPLPSPSPTRTPNLTATARILANQQATLTAIAERTQAAADKAAGQENWRIRINDPFSTNRYGWWEGSFINNEYIDGSIKIVGGKFHWDLTAVQSFFQRIEPDLQYHSDLELSVDGQMLEPLEQGDFGLVFRQVDNNNYYYFGINSAGQFAIYCLLNNEWITLQDWTFSTAVQRVGVNRLRVIALGSHFEFFINDRLVTELEDDRFARGGVGLAVEVFNIGDRIVVDFDNFVLRTP